MFCPKCGTQLDDDLRFCTSCGAQVGQDRTITPQKEPDPQAMRPDPVSQPVKSPRSRKRFAVAGIAVIAIVAVVLVVYNSFFAPYQINEERFPDAALRMVLADQVDLDKDGAISRDEAAALENLDIIGATSVSGLNIFENLRSITLHGENLRSADLGDCPNLKSIVAKDCPNLVELDISSSNKLEALDVSGSSITKLDLAGKSSLGAIECDDSVVLENLDATPLHEYWVVSSYEADDSITPSAYCYDLKATYDERGNLVKLVSSNAQYGSETYTYSYDEQDRCIETKTQGRSFDGVWTISYDDAGLMSKASSSIDVGYGFNEGTQETVTYDEQGLPITHGYYVSQGGGSADTITYDAQGAVVSIAQSSVDDYTYSITNDDTGKMTAVSYSGSTGNPIVFKMDYDGSGRLSAVQKTTSEGSYQRTFSYDEQGLLVNATNRNSFAGEVPKYQTADVSSTKFEYDSHGRLVKVTPTRSGSGMLQGYSLGYERILTTRDTVPNFSFIDLSDPLEPHLNELFWSMNEYLWVENFAYQGSMKNIMAKVSSTKTSES